MKALCPSSRRRRTTWIFANVALPFYFILVSLIGTSCQHSTGKRALAELAGSDLSTLVSSRDPVRNLDTADPNSHLSKILIPRARTLSLKSSYILQKLTNDLTADTANNTFVKDYIVSTLRALDWHIEEDTFTDMTPYGEKKFTNVIATKDPDAPRRLVLTAHFDSKYFADYPHNQFVGATDSAAPCAILLDVAEALNPLLDKRKDRLEEGLEDDEDVAETTLQLVFFDGEEAFKDWTATDSIYGARHLAEKWATTYMNPHPKRRLMAAATQLSTIEHLVLLDLLGSPDPRIRSYFLSTAWLFDALASAERRLGQTEAFDNTWDDQKSYFIPRTGADHNYGYIEDDHVPFLKKGVNILHVIPSRFPSVWHTLKDDASALHLPTMKRWNLIFRLFTAEYLGLRPESSSHSQVGRANGDLPSYGRT